MPHYFTSFLFLLLFYANTFAQSSSDYTQYIDQENIKEYVNTLASDAFEGRETGKKGQKMAANYLVEQLKDRNVQPGNQGKYKQFYKIAEVDLGGWIAAGKDTLKYGDDFLPLFFDYKINFRTQNVATADACDLGKLEKQNVKDKTLIVTFDQACQKTVQSVIKATKSWQLQSLIIASKRFERYHSQMKNFHGKTYLIKDTSFQKNRQENTPIIIVPPKVSQKIKPKKEKHHFKVNSISVSQGSNVVGIIEGSHPKKKDEFVVLSAHYDHLGKSGDEVYNGADDNATGTAAMLEIAEAFQKAKEEGNGPERSILILPVSGEEKGLLGSDYYSKNPTAPLKNIVADLNIDMIGRVDEKHKGNPNYIYLIGSDRLSQELHEISEKANEKFLDFDLDYTFNAKDDPNRYYYRSDHYNFAKNDIPSIFYFSGIHEDYHKPTDTMDKINYKRVAKVTKLVFHTAWMLGNREKRPELD